MTPREKILITTIILVDKKSRDGQERDLAKRLIAIDEITAPILEQVGEIKDGEVLIRRTLRHQS